MTGAVISASLSGLVAATALPAAAAGATITVSPSSGGPGALMRLNGTGWTSIGGVTVTLNGVFACGLSPNGSGVIANTACFIPSVPFGSQTLTAEQNSNTLVANTSFSVTPRITSINMTFVSPSTVVTVYAGGLAAGSAVTAQLDGGPNLVTNPASPNTDSTGTISNLQVTIPATATAGVHTLSIRDALAHSATKKMTVYTPNFALSPTSGGPGGTVNITGSGWRPLDGTYFVTPNGQSCSTTSDSGGNVNFACTVPSTPAGATLFKGEQDNYAITINGNITIVPRITYFPTTSVSPGTVIRVDTGGLAAGSAVTVTDNGTPVTTNPASPTTDSNGSMINLMVTIPVTDVAGSHTLVVKDGSANQASTKVIVYKPTIKVSPTSGTPGATMLVSGTKWRPSAPVYVYLHGTYFCGLNADVAGSISGACTVPSVPVGAEPLLAQQDSNAIQLTGTFTILPAVTYLPNPSVSPGTIIRVDTAGLTASSAVTYTLTGSPGNLVTNPVSPVTDINGSATNIMVTIPAAAAAGTKTLTVKDAAAKSAKATISVYKPVVTLSAATGVVGSPLTITVTGYRPFAPAYVYLHGTYFFGMTADQNGNASGATTVPNVPAGADSLTVQDNAGITEPALTFTVMPAITYEPNPAVTPGATNIRLDTYGLAASTAVTAKFDGTAMVTNPASPTSDANGSMVNLQVTIPAGATAGSHTVAISDGTNTANATMTVYTPTMTFSDTSGTVGSSFAATGSGWRPNDNIAVYMDTTYFCNLSSDGSGDVAGYCTVPSMPAGAHALSGLQDSGAITVSLGNFTIQ